MTVYSLTKVDTSGLLNQPFSLDFGSKSSADTVSIGVDITTYLTAKTLTISSVALGSSYESSNAGQITPFNIGNVIGLTLIGGFAGDLMGGSVIATLSDGSTLTRSFTIQNNNTGPTPVAGSASVGLLPTACRSASLACWYSAKSGQFQDNAGTVAASPGAAVAVWKDKSGNGNHATQSNAGNQPISGTDTLYGYPSIKFNGSTSAFNHPYGGELGTAIVLFRADPSKMGSAANGGSMTLLFSGSADGGKTGSYYMQAQSTDGGNPLVRQDFFRLTSGEDTPAGPPTFTPWKNYSAGSAAIGKMNMMGVRNDGQNLTTYKGKYAISPITMAKPLKQNSNTSNAGANIIGTGIYSGNFVGWFAGDILEVLIFSGALNINEYNAVIDYLQSQYPLIYNMPVPTYIWPAFQATINNSTDETGLNEGLVMLTSQDGDNWIPVHCDYMPRVPGYLPRDMSMVYWASALNLIHSDWTGNACPLGFDLATSTDGVRFTPKVYVDATKISGFPVSGSTANLWAPEWVRNSDSTPYLLNGLPVVLANASANQNSFLYYLIQPTDASFATWTYLGTITFNGAAPTTSGGMIDGFLMYDLPTKQFVLSITSTNPPQYVQFAASNTLLGAYTLSAVGVDGSGIRAAAGGLDFEGTTLLRINGKLRWYGDNRGGGYWSADNATNSIGSGWTNVKRVNSLAFRPQHGSPMHVSACGGIYG